MLPRFRPGGYGWQTPPTHCCVSVGPHRVPSGTGVAVPVQTGEPLPHSTSETRQAPTGVQSVPCWQTHAPVASQAM